MRILVLFLGVLLGASISGVSAAPPPETINIQGALEAPGGGPVTGSHDYQIGFHDADTGGSEIGVVSGTVTFSDSGRFSIDAVPPGGILSTNETWYELAIDVGDDGIDPDDIFPDRVRIHSVPFALLAADANLLDGSPASSFATVGQVGGFQTSANVTSNSPGDLANDDFVFGSDQLDDDGNNDHVARFFFDKSKGAFRAGRMTGTEWDDANLGNNSTAMGLGTTASGDTSTAMGYRTTASGPISAAMGSFTTAGGFSSTALGERTDASGDQSTAMGFFTTASGTKATAMGEASIARGNVSTAMGRQTDASGSYSTAMGRETTASGTGSAAMGSYTTASGDFSFAAGRYSIATAAHSTALGYNAQAEGVTFPKTRTTRYVWTYGLDAFVVFDGE